MGMAISGWWFQARKKKCASKDQLKLDQSTLNIEMAIPMPSMEKKNYDLRLQNMFVFEGWGDTTWHLHDTFLCSQIILVGG